jgi:putative tricarboxylic transport membrane protein
MIKYDRMSSLFSLGFAFAICLESIRIGPGALSNPGPGFVPLICGLVLGIIGIIVFISSYISSPSEDKVALWGPDTRWRDMILTTISLTIYALLIDFLGFHLITLLWMIFICRGVGRMGWMTTFLISAVTIISSYLIFSYYLGIRFPLGVIWGV